MYALTNNVVDWVFIILTIVGIVGFVLVSMVMDKHNDGIKRRAMRRAIRDYSDTSRGCLKDDQGSSTTRTMVSIVLVLVACYVGGTFFGNGVDTATCKATSTLSETLNQGKEADC